MKVKPLSVTMKKLREGCSSSHREEALTEEATTANLSRMRELMPVILCMWLPLSLRIPSERRG